MATVEAKWSGKWPCLCHGKWTLIVDGIDVSDKIPEELRDSPMGTYGFYDTWYFDRILTCTVVLKDGLFTL